MVDADQGLTALKEFRRKKWGNLSESDTRCKMIDQIFTECLGWSEDDISREEHKDTGFIDYVFRQGTVGRFVVEAKRNGTTFEVPATLTRRRYKIDGVISKTGELIGAIDQAQKYCISVGVYFGIVTNGSQYVAFEAFRRNGNWKEGKCLVFNGLKDIEDNFPLFWNVFSKESVIANSLRTYVSQEKRIQTFKRPLDFVHFKEAKLPRNDLYQFMEPFASHFFGTLTEDSKIELLRDCYVYLKAHTDAEHLLREYFLERIKLLKDRYNIHVFVESETDAGQFASALELNEEEFYKRTPVGKLHILLGGVGAGKTTFLHRLFKIVLGDRENLIWFYVDFTGAHSDPSSVGTYVYKSILEEFRNKYISTASKLANASQMSSLQPVEKDIVLLFSVLRANGYSTVLVLDNVDQHWYGSPETQEKIFLEAQYLAKSLRVVPILSLREETFFRSTVKGVFDAYTVDRHTIPPPDFEKMVEKRLDTAIKLLQSPETRITEVMGISPPPPEKREEMAAFLQVVRNSVIRSGPTRKAISRFMISVSRGDMRQALRFFNSYLSSGNTKVGEILARNEASGPYIIQYHAFLKSVILGDRKYYTGTTSEILNMFDMDTDVDTSHFTSLRILKYAQDRMGVRSEAGLGMVDIDTLKDEAGKVGISLEAIDSSLEKLARSHLIELDNGASNPKESSHYAIAPTGDYYLAVLVNRFIYLDLVLQDTPLADKQLAEFFYKILSSSNLEVRVERVDDFLDYLQKQEDLEFSNMPELTDSPLTNYRFIGHIKGEFEKEKVRIFKNQTGFAAPPPGTDSVRHSG